MGVNSLDMKWLTMLHVSYQTIRVYTISERPVILCLNVLLLVIQLLQQYTLHVYSFIACKSDQNICCKFGQTNYRQVPVLTATTGENSDSDLGDHSIFLVVQSVFYGSRRMYQKRQNCILFRNTLVCKSSPRPGDLHQAMTAGRHTAISTWGC